MYLEATGTVYKIYHTKHTLTQGGDIRSWMSPELHCIIMDWRYLGYYYGRSVSRTHILLNWQNYMQLKIIYQRHFHHMTKTGRFNPPGVSEMEVWYEYQLNKTITANNFISLAFYELLNSCNGNST